MKRFIGLTLLSWMLVGVMLPGTAAAAGPAIAAGANNAIGLQAPVRYTANGQVGIDATLAWNTFLGGSGTDYTSGIALDSSGNVYVSGGSTATWGRPLRAYTGGWDTFVAKLNTKGRLEW